MPDVHVLAVLAASVAAFVLSSTFYGVFDAQLAEIDEWTGGLLLGLALWIGFPFVL